MKSFILVSMLLSAFGVFANEYPKGPDQRLTPGSLCGQPDEYRYPERIPYCDRDVSSDEKDQIFQLYRNYGYRLNITNRADYKIDHFIPLCAGGSNNINNLWPQHISIFTITDPLESVGCEKLKTGKITQRKLIEAIMHGKRNLQDAPRILQALQALK